MINLLDIFKPFRSRRLPAEPVYDIVNTFCKPFEDLPRYKTTISYTCRKGALPFYGETRTRMYEYLTIVIWDIRVIEWICVITGGHPAMTVMYLTYLQYWCKTHDCRHPNLETFKEAFSKGFPSQEDLRTLWYSCKIERVNGSDNLLDQREALKPIQF